MTYPEISDFFEKYIKGTEPLPVKEYYENIGINYFEKGTYDSSKVSLGILVGFNGSNFFIEKVSDESPGANVLKAGDIIDKIEGKQITTENVHKIFAQIRTTHHVGDSVSMTVLRDNKSVELEFKLTASREKHVFSVDENATEEQVKLRNAWMRNL